MLREALAAGILVLVLFAPTAPALPPDCTAALTAEESIQNDADSGDDAGDSADAALRIPRDGYYWGYLSAINHGASDLNDWYVFAVPVGTISIMANVIVSAPGIAPDFYLPDDAQEFRLTLIAPDGTSTTVTSAGGSARFQNPVAGDYLIRLWTAPIEMPFTCTGAGMDAGTPATTLARNHGLYVGCHPVCVEAALDAR